MEEYFYKGREKETTGKERRVVNGMGKGVARTPPISYKRSGKDGVRKG